MINCKVPCKVDIFYSLSAIAFSTGTIIHGTSYTQLALSCVNIAVHVRIICFSSTFHIVLQLSKSDYPLVFLSLKVRNTRLNKGFISNT